MRNILRAVILVLILSGFSNIQAQPGFPSIVTAPNVTIPCGQTCTNLTASALGGATDSVYSVAAITYPSPFPFPYNQGTAVSVHTDDVWSSAVTIGWNFCFFGVSYGSFIVSSNGAIGFNTANANAGANWSIPGPAPFTTENDMLNTIMAPWQDLDPTNQGNVYYLVGGVAPYRYIQVSWDNCTMYGAANSVNTAYCSTADHQTQMAVLYETTNIIEVYIAQKDAPCNTGTNGGYWNNGWAIEGIMNNTGTVAYTVPGRNATQFGPLTNDAYRFTPAGSPNYTITWSQNGNTIGTGNTINVCPNPGSTHYVVSASYHNCDNTVATVSTNVFVGLSNLTVADSASQPNCSNPNGSVFATFNSTTGVISYGWAPGGAGQTSLTNVPPGTYVFTVQDSLGCVKRDTEVLTASSSLLVRVGNDTANSCTGTTNNGILTATVTGGAPNYTYLWNPGGSTTNPVTGLNVGSYSVTVTDRNGCTGSATGAVSVVTHALTFATPQIKNVSCSGGNNGQIIAPVNGGTNPVVYTWSGGNANVDTLSNLTAGTYNVTAVDANGCSATASYSVTQPSAVAVVVANDTVSSCSGSTTSGTLSASASGGTPGYTYLWTNNLTTNPITGLSAGGYTVTATDANGCSASASANVVVNVQPITFAAPRITNVTCSGGTNGRIIVGINGGTNPITYTWSVGTGHSDTLANIPAGTYTVTAVDANGCSATASYVVTQPLTRVSVTVANDSVTSCSGQTNIGTLTAQVTGGTPLYTYSWTNQATTATISGLTTGTFTVSVSDVFGCSASATGSVVVKSSSLSISGQVSNPVCAGQKGLIIVNETGGVLPINYNWSSGRNVTDSLTTDTLSGVAAGTFTVTVTDVNGCSASASFTLAQPTFVGVSVPNDTIVNCTGVTANGVLTATASGGTPGYTYLWSNTQTANPLTGLSVGTYSVTATDRVGCTASASGSVVVIGNPVTFNAPQITNAACAGTNSGQIILSTSGGTSPITFTWSGGTTQNDTLRNLAAGNYSITATDVNGCSATASYTVNQAAPIVFGTPVIVNVGCTGAGNGSITVNTTGGTGAVTYAWSSGGITGATITGPAGGYVVTATDSRGCTVSAAYTISQAPPIAIASANIQGVSCTDSGSIALTVSGGTAPYTFTWSPGTHTGGNITGLSAGGYNVTVTDLNGCSTSAHYIVGHASCGACPAVTTNNNVTIPCSQTCTNLIASAFSAQQTTSYSVAQIPYAPTFPFNTGTPVLVNTDDLWSPVINIGFNFCFFGTPHNQIVIGSNGEISFNLNNAGGFNNWSIPGPLPPVTQADQRNTIMCPWQDLDPTNHGRIYYNLAGTAPCRKFEVSWYDVPMFGDSSSVDPAGYCDSTDHQTQMVVLYETTNDIDMYIQNKDVVCNNSVNDPTGAYWNGGLAVEAIVNPSGATVVPVPGRNATQWTAHNDAWRFSPAGAPNFTIQWFQGGNLISTHDTVNVCPSVPTTYTVLATYTNCDNSQVIVGDSVYVTPGGHLRVNIDSVRNILCNGDSDGAVYASYSDTGGTVVSFGWNTPNGANQTSLVGLPAGTYVFTVTTTTCVKSDTVVLVNPAKVLANVPNDTFSSCSSNNLGVLTSGASGGTPGYTYLWSNGNATSSISGLTPGTYTLTVTDSHGCTGSASATVTRIQGNLTFTTPQVTNATCTVGGKIIVGVTGGVAPITYTWSPTEPNTDTLTGLAVGTYLLTATDAGGCSVTASFTITQPAAVRIDSAHVTKITCNGANNGAITVFASGGTPPLNYAWTPTQTDTNALSGLGVGTYTLTVTDVAGCSASASYIFAQPSAIAADSVRIVDVTCTASGSVFVLDTGGVAPLRYVWSNGSTTDSITNVAAGSYTLTVTDAHGCSITASYTVGTAPGGILFGTPVIVNTTCNGDSTGSITVTATGGNGNITYVWSNGATTATISNLPLGSYSVTASDNGGCSASTTYNITQPAPVTFGNPVITNVTCNGSGNGKIVASATGGTGAIVYTWSVPNLTGDTLSGLTAGVYCVTATDSVGCSASICYNVSQPSPITLDSSSISPITCVSPGKIILYVSGGTGVYTYNWTGATGRDTATVTGAGTVSVVITDANGCTDTATFNVGAALGAVTIGTPVITPVTCNGNSNGSITVVATDSLGGPITFVWNNGATAATISNLAAGQYCVTATDSLGCSASACYNLAQPAAIVFNQPVLVQPSCNGSANGTITVSTTGGTGTVTYTWPSQVGATDTALVAGTYTVTATDSVGCSATASYTLTQPTAISFVGSTSVNITCSGANNGSVTLSVSGGTSGYTYTWTNGATTSSLTGLSASTYCVTVLDSHGCSASSCYTITEPTPLVIDTAVINEASCVTGGSVVLTVSGGTTPYTYIWSSNASTTDSAGNIAAGNINVTVTDHNGCSVTATYVVPAAPNSVVIDSGHVVNNLCNGGHTGSITVTATGGIGSLHYGWSTPPGGTTNAITGLAAGSYAITVTDSLGCSASASYSVTQPSAIIIDSIASHQVTCTTSGSLVVYAHGGTGAFVYTWQGSNVIIDSLGGLSAGSYGVTVTDQNGCSITGTGTVTNATGISSPTFNNVQPLCFGLSNGSATVVPVGGVGPYTYLWSPGGQTTATISGLATGNYCVTVHDANGCSIAACDSLGQPAPLVISNFVAVQATCNTLGSIAVVPGGGTPGYTYSWTGTTTGTSNPITGLAGSSNETVVVTDHNGCSVSGVDSLLPAPLPLTLSDSSIVNNLCHGGNTGSIAIVLSGGSGGNIVYSWSNGGTAANISNLIAGTYRVTAVDGGGCTFIDSFTVTQPGPYSAIISAPHLVCPGNTDTATVLVTGGVPNYSYAWSPGGQTTQTIVVTGLTVAGTTEIVTVTDNVGCTTTATITLGAAPQIVDTAEVVPHPCAGGGSVTIVATGGTGALTYNYTPGGTPSASGVLGNLPSNSYTYTITDTLGCSVNGTFIVPPSAPADVYSSVADSASCFGFSDGKIIVTEDSLQNAPFTYSINGGPFKTSNEFDSLAAGVYTVVVENSHGCTDTLLDTVGQPAQMFLSFTPDTIQGTANYATPLTPNVVNAINPVYSWTPSAGLSCSNCENPTVTISAPALYYLTVSDSLNPRCAVTDSVWVLLKGPLVMPDAFTPNGDGKNDFFGPVSHTYVIVKEFHIYNRWGQLVHNSTSPWDGKFDNKEQPSGTYIYYIVGDYEDPANAGHYITGKQEGAVTLLR